MEHRTGQIQEIRVEDLLPHPENSNSMDAASLRKLRRHIERTGRYEPLIVRPHPELEGRFQLVNGHHRLRVLKAIGRKKVECVVWDADDCQTRLYLATLNRLSGRDVPERRASLIEGLLDDFASKELAQLLPETESQIRELERLADLELSDLRVPGDSSVDVGPTPIILEFMLDDQGACTVNLAVDLALHQASDSTSRGRGLVEVCRAFLARCTK